MMTRRYAVPAAAELGEAAGAEVQRSGGRMLSLGT